MIRTVVVDDDFMAASVHRSFAERVPGFTVVGEATTGSEALSLVDGLEADLLLLDIYLLDMSGLELMRHLREAEHEPVVDVIAITSAKDVKILRGAMHHGVIHYLVKPFSFTRSGSGSRATRRSGSASRGCSRRNRGTSTASTRFCASAARKRSQRGFSAPALALVAGAVRESEQEVSATEVALRTGISRGTAR